METTGGFSSAELLAHESECLLPALGNKEAIEVGRVAMELGLERSLPIAIEIRIGDWVVFKAALPGSKPENDGWINRKANVVKLTKHSTMFERVSSEESQINWHQKYGVEDATHAIHGGGFPLNTIEGFKGTLLISGLPQVEDHMLAVEIIKSYLQRLAD